MLESRMSSSEVRPSTAVRRRPRRCTPRRRPATGGGDPPNVWTFPRLDDPTGAEVHQRITLRSDESPYPGLRNRTGREDGGCADRGRWLSPSAGFYGWSVPGVRLGSRTGSHLRVVLRMTRRRTLGTALTGRAGDRHRSWLAPGPGSLGPPSRQVRATPVRLCEEGWL